MRIEDFKAYYSYSGVGKSSGQTYMGDFIFKVGLNPLEVIESDRYYRELLGGNPLVATSAAQEMAFALAQLKYRVIKAPAWWSEVFDSQSNFFDYGILIEVLNKAIEAERQFQDETQERLNQAQERISKMIRSKKKEDIEEDNEEE
jgi:hypothetical protein